MVLNRSRVGCHVANSPLNNFSYADNLVIILPSESALNDCLDLCNSFATEH